MRVETALEVNRHLNGEVEAMVLRADELQAEAGAHQRRAEELAELLAREKRERQKASAAAAAASSAAEAAPPQVGASCICAPFFQ